MKIAYATDFDVLNILDRTAHHPKAVGHRGRCYYAAKSLEDESTTVEYLGPLSKKQAVIPKVKWRFYRYFLKKKYHAWVEPAANQYYAAQIQDKLRVLRSDILMAPEVNLIAYLDCQQPVVLWTDTLYAGLIGTYSDFSNLCQETTRHFLEMDRLALSKCKLAIFPSAWAAKVAIENYQVDPSKVKVVPFGANIECNRTITDIKELIEARPSNQCKLLFIGTDWKRKGGDIALAVVKELYQNGVNVELTIVGCQPEIESSLRNFVVSLGFISKSTAEGVAKIDRLIAESHFLIVPSRSETYGNVFCEANSFGVPCIATKTDGIATVIKDDLNGKAFSPEASVGEYCAYIQNLFSNYSQYKQLALSSFNEYETRLNWSSAGQAVKKLLVEIV